MGGMKIARSKKVKYLGVWIDDGQKLQDQVEAVRRKCFAGLAKIEECPSKFDEEEDILCTRAAVPRLLLCCLARVLIRVET